FRPGATLTQRAVMVAGELRTEATYAITVEDVSPSTVRLNVRVVMADGEAASDKTQEIPRDRPIAVPHAPGDEAASVTVPAGTFACRHARRTAIDALGEWVTDAWYDPSFPVPYKLVISGPHDDDRA